MAVYGYKAKYLGGHAAFPKPMKVTLMLMPNYLEIPEMPLRIPYNRITNVQSMTKEQISVLRFLLVGLLALAWKKKKLFMVLSYRDEFNVEHNMVFDVKNIHEVQPAIYRRITAARGGAASV